MGVEASGLIRQGTTGEAGRAGIIVLDPATLVLVAGIGEAAAKAGARTLLQAGAGTLISWGVAGGLAPELPAGRLLLPKIVQIRDAAYNTYPDGRERLQEMLQDSILETRPLLHTARALSQPQDKAMAYRQSGAAACDMESGSVAQEAARAQVPFLVLRAVCDPANRALPPWLPSAASNGIGKLGLQVAVRPDKWLTLYRLAKDFHAALLSLNSAAIILRRAITAAHAATNAGRQF